MGLCVSIDSSLLCKTIFRIQLFMIVLLEFPLGFSFCAQLELVAIFGCWNFSDKIILAVLAFSWF